ncbi:MAG: hypothetical protein FWF54_02180 [Candidatus Azobacteroides sp.]|nr:hypothetical protein [Candidatus Azobacteroides sp.]
MSAKANRKYINLMFKYVYAPIIAPIIVAIILSFIQINKLKNKVQNTLIQGNKTEILQNLGDSVTILRKDIQKINNDIDMFNQQSGNNNKQTNKYYAR